MRTSKKFSVLTSVLVLGWMLTVCSPKAFARNDENRDRDRDRDKGRESHQSYGRHDRGDFHDRDFGHDRWLFHDRWFSDYQRPHSGIVISFPGFFAKVLIHGGIQYYYYEGQYYKRGSSGYVMAIAPIGAVITTLPSGYRAIKTHGKVYYYCSGVYYQPTQKGYLIIKDPTYEIAGLSSDVQIIDEASSREASWDINIPNKNGSYISVKIKRSGDGFSGPQGEYYFSFPSVEQLKEMYGK